MSVQQAVQGQRECAGEIEAMTEFHRMALSKKMMSKARSIERIIAKEKDRGQYRRMKCGVGKPRANPAIQVTATDDDGTQTTHEGKEAVQDACMKSIGKRYSQDNNSPFLTGQLLDDLG